MPSDRAGAGRPARLERTETVADQLETFDEPRWALIELMFFAYRDFVQDADRVLAADGFGRAHHRVLYFATRRPGLTVAELLDILKITKQSLNRVLKDLLDRDYMTNRLGEEDRRQRHLEATPRGAALIERIAAIQSARFSRAFARLGPEAEGRAAEFLESMIDPVEMLAEDAPAEADSASDRVMAGLVPATHAETSRRSGSRAETSRRGCPAQGRA